MLGMLGMLGMFGIGFSLYMKWNSKYTMQSSSSRSAAQGERKALFDALLKRREEDLSVYWSARRDFEYSRVLQYRHVKHFRQSYVPVYGHTILRHQVHRTAGTNLPSPHASTLVYGFDAGTSRKHHVHLTVDGKFVRSGTVHVTAYYDGDENGAFVSECSTSYRFDEADGGTFRDGSRDVCSIARFGAYADALVNAFAAYATGVKGRSNARPSSSRARQPNAQTLVPPLIAMMKMPPKTTRGATREAPASNPSYSSAPPFRDLDGARESSTARRRR